MKITPWNLIEEYPNIKARLPKEARDVYPTIAEFCEFYSHDGELAAKVDDYIARVNKCLEEGKSGEKIGKDNRAKPKPENEVTELPSSVVFIKSYCGRAGKVKTKTQVYTFIKKLQKAIAEKKIRKTSEYAPQIVYIRNRLIAFYNEMKSGAKTYEIPGAKLAELKKKCNMRWAGHVTLIREYINILNDTKTGLKGKARKLLKKIETSEFSGEVKKTIADITESLKDYLAGKVEIYCENGKTRPLKGRF